MTIAGLDQLHRSKQDIVFHAGVFSIFISIWALCDNVMRQAYLNDLSMGFYLTFLSLSLAVTPIALFLNVMQRKRYQKFYYFVAFGNLFMAMILFLLQILHIVNYNYSIPLIWTGIGILVIGLLCTVILDKKKGFPSYLGGVFHLGTAVMVICVIIEILRVNKSINYQRGGYVGVGLFVFQLSLAFSGWRAIGIKNKEQKEEIIASREKTAAMGVQLVTALVNAVEAKDPYTSGHSNRVAMYAREIARRDGKDKEYLKRLFYMGIVHDIGKISIPDYILQKPGRLTDEEYAIIKHHPEKGEEILADVSEMPWINVGVRSHHERYDGKGYPDGLAGTSIPEEARIIAVADAYDAMTSDRAYRSHMDQAKVRKIIEEGKGSQFDPHFADIMIQMIDEDTAYSMHGSTGSDLLGIVSLTLHLEKAAREAGAFYTSEDSFQEIYNFLKKYARRNHTHIQLILLTMQEGKGDQAAACIKLTDAIRNTIRSSDIMAAVNESQYMVILMDSTSENTRTVIERIRSAYGAEYMHSFPFSYEIKQVEG